MIKRLDLPKKPSQLIHVTLKDLRRVERMKKTYVINMDKWHEPNSHCAVCFAGAVMSRVCKPDEPAMPYHGIFSKVNQQKFYALDSFRLGELSYGLESLGIRIPFGMAQSVDVTEYADDKVQFKKDMENIIKLFRKFGL
jgi:hypothetical protein